MNLTPEQRASKINQIYIASCICNIIVNFDHGIIPASTFILRKELGINDLFLGVLGSMIFFGLMSGSLISGYLFTKYSCRKLILISLVLIIIGVLSFTVSGGNKFCLIFSRFISGFFQVFLVVYYPVWVDCFAGTKKTMWLTFLQVGVPLGVFLGYGITVMFNVLSLHFKFFGVSFCVDLRIKNDLGRRTVQLELIPTLFPRV